ncbi:tail protein X [Iodobacter ciconiae]|uniref:Phage tail protein n=1 Tax=Iodobacter ciconiae TaxID=2496266 RepID=A0A3S8ZPZ0_9NEIS|nr:tail protein X [Iodobacter ciconiae]AZN35538.1 phage tail protein [Iodobacter ciconiae]
MQVIASQGDTLDAICFRVYGKTASITEAVLAANHRLAEMGPVLRMGTVINLPDISPPESQKTIIQLWD